MILKIYWLTSIILPAASLKTDDAESMSMRKAIVRYSILASCLCLWRGSEQLRGKLSTANRFKEAGTEVHTIRTAVQVIILKKVSHPSYVLQYKCS